MTRRIRRMRMYTRSVQIELKYILRRELKILVEPNVPNYIARNLSVHSNFGIIYDQT